MEINEVQKLLTAFSSLAGFGCVYLDSEFNSLYECSTCGLKCPLSIAEDAEKAVNQPEINTLDERKFVNCREIHKRAAYQAERFGGQYIYFCMAGLMFCILPLFIEKNDVKGEKKSGCLLAGPIMATEKEDFIPEYLAENSPEKISAEMMEFLSSLDYVSSDKINYSLDILKVIAEHINGVNKSLKSNEMKLSQQQQIGNYIQKIKTKLMSSADEFIPYPYDKEKLLSHAIMSGNESDAKRYLNEILGHIFFSSATSLDAIKIRAMELTVLISRAALDGGADNEDVHHLNTRFISDFFELESIEDVCYALTEILHSFSEATFKLNEVKHADLLSHAISYMRENYMHKITLDDVANHVYISPSYLSRIFKDELQMNFSNYLNMIRIDKSKILLLTNKVSLIETAELVGFVDQSYFNKVFKKQTGITPKKYREQNGNII
jgi:AraC-type DNA-binding domain-containing proteins